MSDTPREDLFRMTPIVDDESRAQLIVRTDDDGEETARLVGFPIVYGKWAEINGWEGNFMEQISAGAPDRHLKTHRDRVKVLFNHGMDPAVGGVPLGKPDVIESKKRGLWTETPLAETSFNEDLQALLRVEAIDGMSFRFSVSREDWEDEPRKTKANPKQLPQRTIRELKLFEFGPVTFPAYEATTAGIRSRAGYEAFSIAEHGTLTLADDPAFRDGAGYIVTDDALASGHPSVKANDVARLQRAVTRSLKEHQHEGTTRTPR